MISTKKINIKRTSIELNPANTVDSRLELDNIVSINLIAHISQLFADIASYQSQQISMNNTSNNVKQEQEHVKSATDLSLIGIISITMESVMVYQKIKK
jgi:hypothetical protein